MAVPAVVSSMHGFQAQHLLNNGLDNYYIRIALSGGTHTVAPSDTIIAITGTGGATVILPDIATHVTLHQKLLIICDEGGNAGTNAITITPASSDSIDEGGAGSNFSLDWDYGCVLLYAENDTPSWRILASHTANAIAGSNTVQSSAIIADHAVVRGDGGVRNVQDSGIVISDVNVLSTVAAFGITGGSTLNLDAAGGALGILATGGALTMDSNSANTISVGSGAGTGALNVATGGGARPVNIGTGAAAHIIAIGNSVSNTAVTVDSGGSGDITLTSGDDIGIQATSGIVNIDGATITLNDISINSSNQVTAVEDITIDNNLVLVETGGGTDTVTISAPATITTSYVLRMPGTEGTANQVLTYGTPPALEWTTPSGGVGIADNELVRGDAGTTIQGSGITVSDVNVLSTAAAFGITGGTTLNLDAAGGALGILATGGALTMDSNSANTISVGSGAGTGALNVATGGARPVNIGTGSAAHIIAIGNSVSNTAVTVDSGGSGDITLTSGDDIGIQATSGIVNIDGATITLNDISINSSNQVTAVEDITIDNNLVLVETGGGTDTVTISAPATITTSYVLRMPGTEGTANQVLTYGTPPALEWATPSGGGGITLPIVNLEASDFLNSTQSGWSVSALAPAITDTVENFVTVRAFDASTIEGVGFQFYIPATTVSLDLTLTWRRSAANGGTVIWQIRANPINDAAGVGAGAWTTVALDTVAEESTLNVIKTEKTVALSALSGVTADDLCYFQITRDTADTFASDIYLINLSVVCTT